MRALLALSISRLRVCAASNMNHNSRGRCRRSSCETLKVSAIDAYLRPHNLDLLLVRQRKGVA
jgi:hypothetical protein